MNSATGIRVARNRFTLFKIDAPVLLAAGSRGPASWLRELADPGVEVARFQLARRHALRCRGQPGLQRLGGQTRKRIEIDGQQGLQLPAPVARVGALRHFGEVGERQPRRVELSTAGLPENLRERILAAGRVAPTVGQLPVKTPSDRRQTSRARLLRTVQGVERLVGLFRRMAGNYASPAGEERFRDTLAQVLNAQYGWGLTRENIALTVGSQTGFFQLFNLLAGPTAEGDMRRILLPLTPEYIGYADSGVAADTFTSRRPDIELLDDRQFKYRAYQASAFAYWSCIQEFFRPHTPPCRRDELALGVHSTHSCHPLLGESRRHQRKSMCCTVVDT